MPKSGPSGAATLIDGDTLPVARLAALAGEFGLRAERARFDWDCLRATPFSHPILLLLDEQKCRRC